MQWFINTFSTGHLCVEWDKKYFNFNDVQFPWQDLLLLLLPYFIAMMC